MKVKRYLWGAAGFLLAACLNASAASQVLLKVPFFPDKTDQCGPATLAGILSFWGKQTNPKDLRKEMYVANLKGTLPMDLITAAETRGLKVTMIEGTTKQLQDELTAGRPVLAMLDMGMALASVYHYVVVTGFDEEKNGFYVHSAGKANQFIATDTFEKRWKKTDHWAMLARAS
jgi:ABC-type bacteriocin/lantibiotic exporter with double-glycine peptidase domain